MNLPCSRRVWSEDYSTHRRYSQDSLSTPFPCSYYYNLLLHNLLTTNNNPLTLCTIRHLSLDSHIMFTSIYLSSDTMHNITHKLYIFLFLLYTYYAIHLRHICGSSRRNLYYVLHIHSLLNPIYLCYLYRFNISNSSLNNLLFSIYLIYLTFNRKY